MTLTPFCPQKLRDNFGTRLVKTCYYWKRLVSPPCCPLLTILRVLDYLSGDDINYLMKGIEEVWKQEDVHVRLEPECTAKTLQQRSE